MHCLLFQDALTSKVSSQELARTRDEKKKMQKEIQEEKRFHDNLKHERLDLESEVRKLRIQKDQLSKKLV